MRVRRHEGCKILSVVCITELGRNLISDDNSAILIRARCHTETVCDCIYLFTCVQRPKADVGVFLNVSVRFTALRQDFLLNLRPTNCVNWLASEFQMSSCLDPQC